MLARRGRERRSRGSPRRNGSGILGRGLCRVLAWGLVFVLGTTLRAIGRGFGKGTFLGFAQASPVNADNPTASARQVAKVVDRNAAGRRDGVTAFFRGESFNR